LFDIAPKVRAKELTAAQVVVEVAVNERERMYRWHEEHRANLDDRWDICGLAPLRI